MLDYYIIFITNGTRKGFVVEFWVCFEHSTHTMMLYVHPTISCFQFSGLLSSFGYVSNIPARHHDALRPPHDFLFPSFEFVVQFWVCFEHSTHYDALLLPHDFVFQVLGLFRTFHTHKMMLYAHPTIFFPSFGFVVEFSVCFEHLSHTQDDALRPSHDFFPRVLGLLSSFRFVSNISHTHYDALRPHHDFLFPSFGFELVRL